MSSDETEVFLLTRRERAYLIDAVMVLMHQMERIPENDKSELPELQVLLERLMEPQATLDSTQARSRLNLRRSTATS